MYTKLQETPLNRAELLREVHRRDTFTKSILVQSEVIYFG